MAESHVAVFTFPFGSHPAPLFSITRRLSIAAPQTIFSFFGTAESNSPFFPSREGIAGVHPCDIGDGVPPNHAFTKGPEEPIDMFFAVAPVELRRGVEAAVVKTGRRVTCVVSDAFVCLASEIARELNVPWVVFCAGSPKSICAHIYTDAIREWFGVEGRDISETLDFIPGLDESQVRHLPEGIVSGNTTSMLSMMLHKMGKTLPLADAAFINCFQQLDPSATTALKSTFKKFLSVGPFNLLSPPPHPSSDPNACIPFLETQKPKSVAYISFGSVTLPSQDEIFAVAEALEATRVPFLWSLKNSETQLPLGFEERTRSFGRVVPWAPQLDVLQNRAVGVFLTHCGWNSVLESIGGGVPMICRPFFGDQPGIMWMIEQVWGIGLGVDGGVFTKEGVMKGFERVLLREEGIKMRRRIEELKKVAEDAVGSEGSSMKDFVTLVGIVSSVGNGD